MLGEQVISKGASVGFTCAPCQWQLTLLIGIVIGLWLALIISQLRRIQDNKEEQEEEEEPDHE